MATTPDPSTVNAGTAGSLVITGLTIAVALILRSGYKRLKKIDTQELLNKNKTRKRNIFNKLKESWT
jgi:hypothetical protein